MRSYCSSCIRILCLACLMLIANQAVAANTKYVSGRIVGDQILFEFHRADNPEKTYTLALDPSSGKSMLKRRVLQEICTETVTPYVLGNQPVHVLVYDSCTDLELSGGKGRFPVVSVSKRSQLKHISEVEETQLFEHVYGKNIDGVLGASWLCNNTLMVDSKNSVAKVYRKSAHYKEASHQIPVFFLPDNSANQDVVNNCEGHPFVFIPTSYQKALLSSDAVSFQYFLTLSVPGKKQNLLVHRKTRKKHSKLFGKVGKNTFTYLWPTNNADNVSYYLRSYKEGITMHTDMEKFFLDAILHFSVRKGEDSMMALVEKNLPLQTVGSLPDNSTIYNVHRLNPREFKPEAPNTVSAVLILNKVFDRYTLDLSKKQLSGIWRKLDLQDRPDNAIPMELYQGPMPQNSSAY